MVTPVINNIVPFDAGVGTVFTFQYTGGITNSYFEIFDINNVIIYDSRDDARLGISQLKQRTIPSATNDYVDGNGVIVTNPLSKMVNDAQYYIQLTVINGEETSTSQKRLFRCITTPLLSVFNNDGTGTSLGKSYILTSANLELYTTYAQVFVDNSIYEDLNCYQFVLYDNSYQKIYTSDVYYNLTDDEGMPIYTKISGLEEKRYFLKVIGKTINGYVIDHDFIAIDVKYKASPQKTTLLVENCLDEGFVKIGTNIHALLYRLKYSPAKFVDDVIQLRDNWLEYYDGFTIDGDFVAYVRFKNPNYNTNLVRISGNGHDVYMNCYKHDNYYSIVELEEMYGDDLPNEEQIKSSYLYFDLRVSADNTRVMLTSDIFDISKMEDAWFNAYIIRKGSVYTFLVIPDKYKMIYVLYDGLNDSRNPLNYEEGETLYLYDAAKRGNSFGGWYFTSSMSSDDKITSPIVAPDYSITLYAKWKPNIYNISYNIPTGVIHTNPSTYTYGTTTTLSDAEKTGYEFLGWYTDDEYVNQITEIGSDEIDDKFLYGMFEPKVYSMIYNLNGGVNNDKNPSTYTTDAEVRLYDANRDGYDFGGWYYDSLFNNSVSSPFIAPPNDTTVYARWTAKTYSISYVDGGDVNNNPSTYTYGTATALTEPSKNGYTFDGWYTDETFSVRITSIPATSTGDIVLYAKWNVMQYTITYKTSYYNSVDGTIKSSTSNPTTYSTGDTFELSDAIPDDTLNYQFEGWYTDENYTEKITALESSMWGTLNLYAKLTPKYDFKYIYDSNYNGWRTESFTSLASVKDEIHIPTYFNDEKILGYHFYYSPSTSVSGAGITMNFLKNTVKFSVDSDNTMFETDDNGNLYQKNYRYNANTPSYYYDENGTLEMLKALIHFSATNTLTSSIFDNVEAIGRYAFYNNLNLVTVVLPENVRCFGESAFYLCENIENLYICYNSSYLALGKYCFRFFNPGFVPTKTPYIYVRSNAIGTQVTSKDSSGYKYIDAYGYIKISTDYDWEAPDI